ncbi:MAG TPA: adenine phosphoribosyltransferase [Chloroflexota bacterium]|jgi:adenine phosphoribosyltransferase|nr:adenine phosphoribosyltransferase [Chloroflexota bacterium]
MLPHRELREKVALLAEKIRDIPDFPKPGILFKDITTLLQDGPAFREAMAALTERCRRLRPDVIVGMESRGFIFGAPVAYELGIGFVPVRKLGKLPATTISEAYALEYGTNTVEMHRDAITPGQRVVIVDDLLATGGTCRATIKLVERLDGVVAGIAFLVELSFLNGRQLLEGYSIESVIQY